LRRYLSFLFVFAVTACSSGGSNQLPKGDASGASSRTMQDRSARPAAATTVASVVQSALCNTDTNTSTYTCTFSSTPILGDAECVKLFETTVSSKCYAAIVSGWLMKTVGSSAGGSGVPFTKRFGLRAYAA